MPAGPVHHHYHKEFFPVALLFGLAAFVYGCVFNSYMAETAVWFVWWYWCGRYVDPDWDLPGITMAEGRIQRELWILAPPLLAASAFYSSAIGLIVKTFKIKGAIGGSHRTWLTHSIIPGTILRQVVICLPIQYAVNYGTFLTKTMLDTMIYFDPRDVWAFLIGQFLGLAMADAIHIILDIIYSKKGDDQ